MSVCADADGEEGSLQHCMCDAPWACTADTARSIARHTVAAERCILEHLRCISGDSYSRRQRLCAAAAAEARATGKRTDKPGYQDSVSAA